MARKRKATGMLPRVSRLLLLAPVLLASCGGTVFHEFRRIEDSVWGRKDTLQFLYDGSFDRETAGYSLAVEARVDASYSYRNLVARVECISGKDSSLLAVDTLCCELFGADGHRKGATAGILYQVGSEPLLVDAAGCDTLLVRVSHIMDTELLEGVSDLGVRLESSCARGPHQSSGIQTEE